MARYYRRAYKKRTYRRRYPYYTSRRRYYARKRRYKRIRRRTKVEYKRVERTLSKRFSLSYTDATINETTPPESFKALTGINSLGYAIGATPAGEYKLNIYQGTQSFQRIGAKINPVKLRIFGTVSLVNPSHQQLSEAPLCVYLRCIVLQVRNGNPTVQCNEENFSSINPVFDQTTGALRAITGKRLFSDFYGEDGYTYTATPGGQYTFYPNPIIREDNLNQYTTLTKVPYRSGIGGSLKLLKNKVYKLNISKNSSFSFRFKTKKPNRLVWPESTTTNIDADFATCKNPIYILWYFIPTTPYAYARFINDQNQSIYNEGSGAVNLSMGVQLYYTDS